MTEIQRHWLRTALKNPDHEIHLDDPGTGRGFLERPSSKTVKSLVSLGLLKYVGGGWDFSAYRLTPEGIMEATK